ncbi:DMT family transporter [Aestuariivirga sp.]|uniref:DMT family transporter n=1 Tax=Aestuariivirga sp. TaxID=2650926 RepID=UPI0039E63816
MAGQQQQIGRAALWMAGWLTATLSTTVAGRELTHAMSVFELMMFRSVIATLILLPFVLANGGIRPRLSQLKLHAIRNTLHYGGQYAWFSAIMLIPLAEVIAIEFTMPLWIAILATAFLGERMTVPKVFALVVGFTGVLMIVKPGHTADTGHAVALAAALLFACTVTLTKYITRRDTALTVIFMMFSMQSILGAVPTYLTWVSPPVTAWPWIAVVAIAGTVSHYCLSKAISLADATIVMPMDFLRLPLTALVGFWLYAEGIDLWSIIGAILILAANTINLLKARSA